MRIATAMLAALLPLSLIAEPLSWDEVRVLRNEERLPTSCEWVSTIQNEPRFGQNQNVALKRVRRLAAKKGATVIVLQASESTPQGFFGGGFGSFGAHVIVLADAYRCSAKQ